MSTLATHPGGPGPRTGGQHDAGREDRADPRHRLGAEHDWERRPGRRGAPGRFSTTVFPSALNVAALMQTGRSASSASTATPARASAACGTSSWTARSVWAPARHVAVRGGGGGGDSGRRQAPGGAPHRLPALPREVLHPARPPSVRQVRWHGQAGASTPPARTHPHAPARTHVEGVIHWEGRQGHGVIAC